MIIYRINKIVIENYVDYLKDFEIMEMATLIVKYGGVTKNKPKLFADRKGFAALCSYENDTVTIRFKYHQYSNNNEDINDKNLNDNIPFPEVQNENE